jgi:Xaa-Pro dipeptidase
VADACKMLLLPLKTAIKPMSSKIAALRNAEQQAQILFEQMQQRGLICAGKSEKELNQELFSLAFELFGIKKYWHKRIVRSGKNTLLPYAENPPDLIVQADDILFFDFGPVFEEWEADYGRTYVLGQNEKKLKLQQDIALAWAEGKAYYEQHKANLTGADLYAFTKTLAHKYGWAYGNEHCGHLIGNFPHEILLGEELINYIHPENKEAMSAPAHNGEQRHWIYEIHFVDEALGIGGFYEQLLD